MYGVPLTRKRGVNTYLDQEKVTLGFPRARHINFPVSPLFEAALAICGDKSMSGGPTIQ